MNCFSSLVRRQNGLVTLRRVVSILWILSVGFTKAFAASPAGPLQNPKYLYKVEWVDQSFEYVSIHRVISENSNATKTEPASESMVVAGDLHGSLADAINHAFKQIIRFNPYMTKKYYYQWRSTEGKIQFEEEYADALAQLSRFEEEPSTLNLKFYRKAPAFLEVLPENMTPPEPFSESIFQMTFSHIEASFYDASSETENKDQQPLTALFVACRSGKYQVIRVSELPFSEDFPINLTVCNQPIALRKSEFSVTTKPFDYLSMMQQRVQDKEKDLLRNRYEVQPDEKIVVSQIWAKDLQNPPEKYLISGQTYSVWYGKAPPRKVGAIRNFLRQVKQQLIPDGIRLLGKKAHSDSDMQE